MGAEAEEGRRGAMQGNRCSDPAWHGRWRGAGCANPSVAISPIFRPDQDRFAR